MGFLIVRAVLFGVYPSFLVMACFPLRDYNILPKKELYTYEPLGKVKPFYCKFLNLNKTRVRLRSYSGSLRPAHLGLAYVQTSVRVLTGNAQFYPRVLTQRIQVSKL